MFYLLRAPVGVAAAVFGYLALQSGEIRVRRSLLIERDRAQIFNNVRNLRAWRDWSPWLLHEPDALLD